MHVVASVAVHVQRLLLQEGVAVVESAAVVAAAAALAVAAEAVATASLALTVAVAAGLVRGDPAATTSTTTRATRTVRHS